MTSFSPASKPILQVLALEPYLCLSHQVFLQGYRKYSRHQVDIWGLPARKWKWRMRAGAIHLADRARAAGPRQAPDVILASDYLNLPDWRSIAPPAYGDAPCILYFHENQVSYPLGVRAPVDFHYGWLNLSSALAADRVLFNSRYHQEEFLEEVARVLGLMSDHVPEDLPGRIRAVASVFPVGIDFEPHRKVRMQHPRQEGGLPVIAWNHRWEYDKNPGLAVDTLVELKRRGIPFRLVLCGPGFQDASGELQRAASALRGEIEHLGFIEQKEEYLRLLRRADIVLSTARHEFFGVSVVEAMYLGCLPVLPDALSYPEIVPPALHAAFLYKDPGKLPDFLGRFLRDPPVHLRDEVAARAEEFDWKLLAARLDRIVEQTHERGRCRGRERGPRA